MSSELYVHEKTNKVFENKKLILRKETITDSEKGFFFRYLYLNKTDDKVLYKIDGKLSKDKNNYSITIQKGDKKENIEVDKKGLLEILKKEDFLKFIFEYLNPKKKK